MTPTIENTLTGWPENGVRRGALCRCIPICSLIVGDEKIWQPNCQSTLSLSSVFFAARFLSEAKSHVSGFLLAAASQRRGNAEEEWWGEGWKRSRKTAVHVQVIVDSFFQALLQADSPYICFLHLSICLLAPCCSEDEKDRRRGLRGSVLFLGSLWFSLQRAAPQSVCPSFTALCWLWVSAWWPTPLHGYCCTSPEGACLDPGSAHLQKTHRKLY